MILDTNVLERMDALVARAGTSDPYELADFLRVSIHDITSNKLIAFVVRKSGVICIGLNRRLNFAKKMVVLMHEVTHVACHMDYLNTFGLCYGELSPFQNLKNKCIARQEYEANVVAADFNLPTDEVLEMLGYNNTALREYRRYLAAFERHRQEYEQFLSSTIFTAQSRWTRQKLFDWRKRMKEWREELEEMQHDLTYCGDFMTTAEIAKEFGLPQSIVDYKLEALRLRGYDLDSVELVSYRQVFR